MESMESMSSYEICMKKHFNNSFNKLCDLELLEKNDGHVVVACNVSEKHLNGYHIVHGGLIFTMMDVAGGRASATMDNGEILDVVTQNSSLSFLRAAKPGLLTAEAEIVRRGRRVIVCTVCAFDGDHTLIAKGDFTYYVVGKQA